MGDNLYEATNCKSTQIVTIRIVMKESACRYVYDAPSVRTLSMMN